MAAAAPAAASGFLAFRVSCCDNKPRRGFGTQKDDKKTNKAGVSREEQRKRKSTMKQSSPLPAQAPILSSQFDAKSNKKPLDIDFEERLEAVRSVRVLLKTVVQLDKSKLRRSLKLRNTI